MHRRDTVRVVPNTPLYIRVDLPQVGEVILRAPSALTFARLVQALDPDTLARTMAAADSTDGRALLGFAGAVGPDALSALGALVGLSWYHPTEDLDAELGGDHLAYGAAVYEELHEAGYSLDAILRLAMCVFSRLMISSRVDREALEKAAFFGPTSAGAGSS